MGIESHFGSIYGDNDLDEKKCDVCNPISDEMVVSSDQLKKALSLRRRIGIEEKSDETNCYFIPSA